MLIFGMIMFATFIAALPYRSLEIDFELNTVSIVITIFGSIWIRKHSISLAQVMSVFTTRSNYYRTIGSQGGHPYTGYIREYDAYFKLGNNATYYIATASRKKVLKESIKLSELLDVNFKDNTY